MPPASPRDAQPRDAERSGPRALVAAPDKFRDSAEAPALAQTMADTARRFGWRARAVPLADGGEGLLDAVAALGGEVRRDLVTGPLGAPVQAEWRLLPAGPGGGTTGGAAGGAAASPEGSRADGAAVSPGGGPVAVIEMARASGLVLAGGARGNEAEAATTAGTGELVAAAVRAGARQVIVGCGGSATTDGGLGAVEALAGTDLEGVDLVVASDVRTPFTDAAVVFGPQKGADAAAIARLTQRLEELAGRYRERFGVDLSDLPGAGAAGGLAGGLVALGGRIVRGFDLVAGLAGLDDALDGADLVVTGEGRFDRTSLAGKVVGGVIERVAGRAPVLVIAGSLDPAVAAEVPPGVEVVSLSDRYGETRSFAEPLALVAEVLGEHLRGCTTPRSGSSSTTSGTTTAGTGRS